jgi:hypothetical protein
MTVTELVAIVPAARNGKIMYTWGPNIGTSAPAATGINAELYANCKVYIKVLRGSEALQKRRW